MARLVRNMLTRVQSALGIAPTNDYLPKMGVFRYPAPGDQPGPASPVSSPVEGIHNNNYYVRDTRRAPEDVMVIERVDGVAGSDATTAEGQQDMFGSVAPPPPPETPAKFTGTVNGVPWHLPMPEWMRDGSADAMQQSYIEKGLPPTAGINFKLRDVTKQIMAEKATPGNH